MSQFLWKSIRWNDLFLSHTTLIVLFCSTYLFHIPYSLALTFLVQPGTLCYNIAVINKGMVQAYEMDGS